MHHGARCAERREEGRLVLERALDDLVGRVGAPREGDAVERAPAPPRPIEWGGEGAADGPRGAGEKDRRGARTLWAPRRDE